MIEATAQIPVNRPEAIRIEDLHKRFGPLEVLRGVSLKAREGDVLSIIGASGSRQEHAFALRQPARAPFPGPDCRVAART